MLRMGGERGGAEGVLRACADDDRNARRDQLLDAGHALLVGQQRPVAHRAAIDDPRHAGIDELASFAGEGGEIRRAAGVQGVISAGIVPANTSVIVVAPFGVSADCFTGANAGLGRKPNRDYENGGIGGVRDRDWLAKGP